jgi:hypothetical protein
MLLGVAKAAFCVCGIGLENDIHTIFCRDFWTRTVIAALVVGAITIFLIVRVIVKEQLECIATVSGSKLMRW